MSEPTEIIKQAKGGYQVAVRGSAGGRKASKVSAQQQQQQQLISPTEEPNNLRSRADAVILALLGEGEIVGSASGDILKDIYLDETPIKNPDGSLNFQNVTVDFRSGTQDQSYIPLASNVEAETAVGIQIKNSQGSVTRTITNPNANAVRIRLMVPSLLNQDEQGNIRGSSVNFKIEVSTQGGAFVQVINHTISGKTNSAYEESYRISLQTTGDWDIRITKITPDSTKTTIQNDLYWQSYTEIIDTKFRYPNSALLAVRVSAEQFQSIPRLAFKAKQKLIKVPHNYNPEVRDYSGVFNGTLVRRYSTNPAWVMYDILANSRYGCGKYIDAAQVDAYSLYSIGQYCDDLVPNGKGGFEPRFTCNCYLQTKEDALKVLEAISSCFRGMLYYAGNSIITLQDKPKEAVRAYTKANVVVEYDDSGRATTPAFSYSGASIETRHTVALVSWSDPDDFYRTKVEVVEDRDGLTRFGYNATELVAFGCTSRSQAHRLGKWTLLSQRELTQTITFRVGAEGLLVAPGEVFKILDPLKTFSRRGGRLKSSSTINQVVLDQQITLENGKDYVLSVVKGDGTLEKRSIQNTAGAYTSLIPTTPFSETPKHIWILESNDLKAQLFQCISVVEMDAHLYEITGVEYNASIYDAVEKNLKFEELPISGLPGPYTKPQPPTNLQISESLYQALGSGGVKVQAQLTWAASPSYFISEYQVYYKSKLDSDYQLAGSTRDLSLLILDISPGIYDFRIRTLNNYGKYSNFISTYKEIYGLSIPPSNVNNFKVSILNNIAALSWDVVPDLDVQVGGHYKIKHTPKKQNVNWSDGFEVASIAGNNNTCAIPLLEGSYLIKAVDSENNQSPIANQISVIAPDILQINNVLTIYEHPFFLGAKLKTTATGNTLRLGSKDYFDSQVGNFDNMPYLFDEVQGYFDSYPSSFDEYEGTFDEASTDYGVELIGYYDFSETVDLGEVYSCRLGSLVQSYIVNESIFFDKTGGLFDNASGLFDGEEQDSGGAFLQISVSNDGITYSDWQSFYFGDYVGRFFKFRLMLVAGQEKYNIVVEQLAASIDMPDRIVSGNFTSLNSGVTRVNYEVAFYNNADVSIVVQNGQEGDYVLMNQRDSLGFAAFIKDRTNANTVRQCTYIAKGYGKRYL